MRWPRAIFTICSYSLLPIKPDLPNHPSTSYFEVASELSPFRMYQDLSLFRLPPGFRGRSAIVVQIWWLVQATIFRGSPQFAYRWRAALLRLFGAQVGRRVIIRPSVTITYPWKLVVGDFAWIGDRAILYSLAEISIGAHSVISQGCHLCAADHDLSSPGFPVRARPIHVGRECWVASDVFVGPGDTIGDGTVVGARSVVFRALPPAMICYGHPCRIVRTRIASS